MAYDQASAYEAPRRAYYDQRQQAPVRQDHGGYPAQQQYDNYDQSYDQGYGHPQQQQQHGGYDDYGYDVNQQSGQYHGDNGANNGYGYDQYDQGYPPQDSGRQDYQQGGYPPQPHGRGRPDEGYGNGQQDGYGPQDRHYDPRYQQRPGRGQPPPNGSRMQRPPPGSQDPRGPPPSNGQRRPMPSPGSQGPRGQPPPPNGQRMQRPPGPPGQDYRGQPPSNGQRMQRPPPPTEYDSRGHPPQSRRPEPQNGHPSDRSGYQEQPPMRGEYDTRDGQRERGAGRERSRTTNQRPPPSQINGEQRPPPPETQPSKQSAMDDWKAKERARMHEAASKPKIVPQETAFPTFGNDRKDGDHGGARGAKSTHSGEEHQRPSTAGGRHGSRPGSSKGNQQYPMPPPNDYANGQQSQRHMNDQMPPLQSYPGGNGQEARNVAPAAVPERVMSPPQVQPPSVNRAPPSTSAPGMESWRTGPPRKQPVAQAQPQPEAVIPQESWRTGPARTAPQGQAVPQPQPTPQPSNQYVAPPAVNQTQQPAYSSYAPQPQPVDTYSRAQTYDTAGPGAAAGAPAHQESLDDLYDDYYSSRPEPAAVPSPPKNREEEIEAEMPDFDSAAPGQTSNLHKRMNGTSTKAAAPSSMPTTQHVNQSVQSLPVQRSQPYAQPQEAAFASQPDLRDTQQDQGGAGDGFVFGVPGEQVRYEQQYGGNQPMRPPQGPMPYRAAQSVPPENMRRFQSPVDSRQMPMRGGPPGQPPPGGPFHPGGRGPLPPTQRSASTRPAMTQTGWSDPGHPRAPTAPPMRQDSRGAPYQDMPRAGSLSNQQHRAPSAPPGQQNMRGMPPPGVPRNGPQHGQEPMPTRPPQQHRQNDPDSLPHHPTPFRPGLMEQGAPQQPKPAPVRNYDARSSTSSHNRQSSISDKPVTQETLEQARLDMEANKASPRLNLRYAKKLVEASHVLASEGGRLDAKATQRNREKYLNEAYKRVKELVRNSYPHAQFFMAECYGSGELGLQVDPKEAFALYQAAAKGGHAAAAFRTAVSCEIGPEEGGGTRKDHAKAVQWYRHAAALGDVAAMFKLGIVLLRALLGVPRDVGEAVSWLQRAAERADSDNPHALHELAVLHESTTYDPAIRAKVPIDEPRALSLFRSAADMGWKKSQFRLGQAYEYGSLGLEIDNRASISWYTKAAAQGEHNAELALSGWYLTGAEGMLEQSDMEAYLWARKAAQSEPPLAKAMFAMGYFTEQGIGCPRSLEEAKRWYGRAASFQFPKALERLEELKKGGGKGKAGANGKLTRDKKKDEENCVVM